MTKLVDLTWTPYHIPFRGAFLTAHGPLNHRAGAIVTLRTDAGCTGHGEIAPLPEHSGTSLDAALNALDELARELRGREVEDSMCLLYAETEARLRLGPPPRLGPRHLPAALICGLETALLDALGQMRGKSIAALLASSYPASEVHSPGMPRACVPVNAVISSEANDVAIGKARAAVKAGFSCLKVKLTEASRAAIERVATIRDAIGPAPRLRLDANEGWSIEQAEWMLDRCAAYDIQYVEQPLPASDLAGMARLRRVSPIPLAADEALTGLASARRILNAEAADVLILKPQLAGGLRACRQIIHEASQRDVACVITSTLEAGVGVAAALHLAAASSEVTLACGLATLDLLEDNLLRKDLPIARGCMDVPCGPGLGVELDSDALKCYE